MIVVHHLNNSRSQRVLWLLEELGLPYEIVRYQRDPKTMLAPKALRDVHPLGKSPVVVDGDVTVAESGAIVEYLIGRYGNGRLKPAPGTPEALRYTYFLHYAEGSFMPPLLLKLVFMRLASAPVPFFAKPIARMLANGAQKSFVDPQLKLHLDYLEGEISENGWFAGDTLTGADIQMSFPLEAAASRGGLDASRPRLQGFLDRIHALPAYQAALERGGDYDLAPKPSR
jgi:glutathione S-transferase